MWYFHTYSKIWVFITNLQIEIEMKLRGLRETRDHRNITVTGQDASCAVHQGQQLSRSIPFRRLHPPPFPRSSTRDYRLTRGSFTILSQPHQSFASRESQNFVPATPERPTGDTCEQRKSRQTYFVPAHTPERPPGDMIVRG